ncbi:MAG: glycosyltransferase [Gluconacetobacter diazotrophicus]|nr:glycosyltransferase [Gluconacetobacter diazotrophicus]
MVAATARSVNAAVETLADTTSAVVRAFLGALNRPPERAGLAHFRPLLAAGMSFRDMAALIVASAEFIRLHGPGDVVEPPFVHLLFRRVLDREPDDGILEALCHVSRLDALVTVADSPEARENVDVLATCFPDGIPLDDPDAYTLWYDRHDRLSTRDRLLIDRHVAALPNPPAFTIIAAAPAERADLLLETLRSLENQVLSRWELVIGCAPDLPPRPRRLLSEAAARVPGVVLVEAPPDGGLATLWDAALVRASGDLVGFLDPGDRLAPTALYELAVLLDADPALALIYTDEDAVDHDGSRSAPLFKTGWSPDMLFHGDTVGQFVVLRRELVAAAGGLRAEAGAHARYELMLRATADLPPARIAHLPRVLFHRGRQPGRPLPFPRERAIAIHQDIRRIAAARLRDVAPDTRIEDSYLGGEVWPRLVYPLPDALPTVSVLVPTRDQPELLDACVSGLLSRTDHPAMEVLVADNGSVEPDTAAVLRRLGRNPRVRVLPAPGPFNWSALNNRLAAAATGNVLVLMNDDVAPLDPDWLRELLRQLNRPGVGIAGARLLYPDDTLQHGGVVLTNDAATHVLRSARTEQSGYRGQLAMARDMSAVTGACLAIRRDLFHALGGADESLPRTANDVELCLRARAAGHRVVWTPHAVLRHVDGASRGADGATASRLMGSWRDLGRVYERWPAAFDADPFLDANLEATDFELVLASPPRRPHPWRAFAGTGRDRPEAAAAAPAAVPPGS